jgi:hypothetical protein
MGGTITQKTQQKDGGSICNIVRAHRFYNFKI